MPRFRVSSFLLLAASMCPLAGCGLSDYEKRIDEQKAYLQSFDEENQLLGDPLEMPMVTIDDKKTKTLKLEIAYPVEFFLRPPKGIASKVKEKDGPFEYQKVALYRYADKGYNILAGSALADPEIKNIPGKPGTLTQKKFQQQVRGALVEFYQREYNQPMPWLGPDFDKTKKDSRIVTNPGAPPTQMLFDAQALADRPGTKTGSLFYLFFIALPQAQPQMQGVIIYQVPAEKADDPVLRRALDFSLKTYSLGPQSAPKRQEYRRMRKIG